MEIWREVEKEETLLVGREDRVDEMLRRKVNEGER